MNSKLLCLRGRSYLQVEAYYNSILLSLHWLAPKFSLSFDLPVEYVLQMLEECLASMIRMRARRPKEQA